MKISAAFLLLFTLSITLQANQPGHYSFDFFPDRYAELPPGEASITWGIGKDAFGNRNENQTLKGKKFVATVMNLFEEVLYSDTVDTPVLHFTMKEKGDLILQLTELGGNQETRLLLLPRGKPLPKQDTRIDSLNFTLANGYFANAVSILYKMKRQDLATKVIEQYALLFPYDYRGSKEIFNSYYDPMANDLIQMPYVTGSRNFIKMLRKAEIPKVNRFEIHTTVGANSSMANIVTTSPVDEGLIRNALDVLQINTHQVNPAKLVLIVNTKKWKLINSRALTDPSSNAFKLRPRLTPTGAVHR